MFMKKSIVRRFLLLVVVLILVPTMLFLSSCSNSAGTLNATDLMKDVISHSVSGKTTDTKFIDTSTDFSVKLIQSAASSGENTFISPLSVLLALSMTANGAQGETLTQMEDLLGQGIRADEMNQYLLEYVKALPSHDKSKLTIANSIWFRDDEDRLHVEEKFLQTNADYYGANAYAAPFNDNTVKDINQWVDTHTDGLIDKIIEQIEEDTIMYLINAMVFDAQWETIYREEQVREGTFTKADGSTQQKEFMDSEENLYLEGDGSYGFIKPYAEGDYGFFALLPKNGDTLSDLLKDLNGSKLLDMLNNPQKTLVQARTPKFSFAYEWKMNDPLKALGMSDAFNANTADFSRLGQSSRGNIYVGEVLHKTYIQVDEKGTKAGAVTKVEIRDESYQESKEVFLERPFLFGIMDMKTGLPLFLGTVTELP